MTGGGDRLPLADRQRHVEIRQRPLRLGNELMPRRRPHRSHHPLVLDPRGDDFLIDHAVAGLVQPLLGKPRRGRPRPHARQRRENKGSNDEGASYRPDSFSIRHDIIFATNARGYSFGFGSVPSAAAGLTSSNSMSKISVAFGGISSRPCGP